MHWTETIRVLTGGVALLTAGAQLTMRYMATNGFSGRREWVKKEKTTSIAALFLLGGIGVGNLTHLHTPVSVSTTLISLGVVAAAWSLVDVWRWVGEQEEVEAHRYSRKRK